ncbi:TetR/AcrR family transcriptional regulator [Mycetocola reblochoni]|uniref:Transcriptional regulator, TetR family n=2 Tax=Mycetocola reblochoni TaxID=331618 RepID=A0A1R4IQF9_9MICO|nr:TetR/AcrR family transcriptional regulator [Mycetocola reblochoni]RLP68424.1 TetR family transcriptional regulator [Mycetocola reblochoni]SJN21835.1 Transcriptional regulator, TetR family [Mycetocola reblochoni REB411]
MTTTGAGRPAQTSHAELRELAMAMFAERGYDDTSLADVARAAGVSRTTLFSYVPAKRDLLWEEHDERDRRLERYLAAPPDGELVEVLVGALLVIARYDCADHRRFASRARIVGGSPELRAYSALRTAELAERIVALARLHSPLLAPDAVGDVARALMAIAAATIEDWGRSEIVTEDLDVAIRRRVAPFLAPLSAVADGSSTRS